MTYKLYIDDIRSPKEPESWVVVRSVQQAKSYMNLAGCPKYISFDHDLGEDETAIEIVNWMILRDMDWGGTFIPKDFDFNVHSANPIGASNIRFDFESYFKHKALEA